MAHNCGVGKKYFLLIPFSHDIAKEFPCYEFSSWQPAQALKLIELLMEVVKLTESKFSLQFVCYCCQSLKLSTAATVFKTQICLKIAMS